MIFIAIKQYIIATTGSKKNIKTQKNIADEKFT